MITSDIHRKVIEKHGLESIPVTDSLHLSNPCITSITVATFDIDLQYGVISLHVYNKRVVPREMRGNLNVIDVCKMVGISAS